ncbi:hypothetical protein [Parasphingopyxis sp.]|uniref:hypothetical protein n=1 Tax=Parasphingopyxis sp. TaxID=1920299 RepID=UPI0026020F44|nr:hypothetical protein [Parasphingopyxis sp.]
MTYPSQLRRAAGVLAIGAGLAVAMTGISGSAAAQPDADRYPTAEEIEAMVPSAEEIRAMIPSEAEIRAMIPSEAAIRAMVPSEAEIRAMIPDIQSVEQCHASGEAVYSEESTDPATGRERVRLMICRDRLVEDARSGALEGLREARAEVAADADIPDSVRVDVLATLDDRIASLSH